MSLHIPVPLDGLIYALFVIQNTSCHLYCTISFMGTTCMVHYCYTGKFFDFFFFLFFFSAFCGAFFFFAFFVFLFYSSYAFLFSCIGKDFVEASCDLS